MHYLLECLWWDVLGLCRLSSVGYSKRARFWNAASSTLQCWTLLFSNVTQRQNMRNIALCTDAGCCLCLKVCRCNIREYWRAFSVLAYCGVRNAVGECTAYVSRRSRCDVEREADARSCMMDDAVAAIFCLQWWATEQLRTANWYHFVFILLKFASTSRR